MFKTDKDIIKWALDQWANHIETGTNAHSQQDVINMLSTCKGPNNDTRTISKMLKKLQPEQIEFVKRIRDLAEKQ